MRLCGLVLGFGLIAAGPARADIEAYQAKPIDSYQAKTIERGRGSEVKPSAPATEMKPLAPAGVDRAHVQGPLDARLVGTWAIRIPGVAWTNRTETATTTTDTIHAGVGAALGVLKIGSDGRYQWTAPGRKPVYGKLEQVVAHRDAGAGHTYWRASNGSSEYYMTASTDGITLYSPATNQYAAEGVRSK